MHFYMKYLKDKAGNIFLVSEPELFKTYICPAVHLLLHYKETWTL